MKTTRILLLAACLAATAYAAPTPGRVPVRIVIIDRDPPAARFVPFWASLLLGWLP